MLMSKENNDIGKYIGDEEKTRLISDLHRVLAWLGVEIPEKLDIDEEVLKREMKSQGLSEKDQPPEIHHDGQSTVDLHHLISRLVNEKELTEKERSEVRELISVLEAREKQDETSIKNEMLTDPEARRIFSEAAGIIRGIVELKDLLKDGSKRASDLEQEALKRRVDDARRWRSLIEQTKKLGDYL